MSSSSGQPDERELFERLKTDPQVLKDMFKGRYGGEAALISLFNKFRGQGFGWFDDPMGLHKSRLGSVSFIRNAVNADMSLLVEIVLAAIKNERQSKDYKELLDGLVNSYATTLPMLEWLQNEGANSKYAQDRGVQLLANLSVDDPKRPDWLKGMVRLIMAGNERSSIILPLNYMARLKPTERAAIKEAYSAKQEMSEGKETKQDMPELKEERKKQFGSG